MRRLSHVDEAGRARMVDVGGKPETRRVARAEGCVVLSPEAFRRVRLNQVEKGDVLTVARIAGIQAAKETSWLIPLCHPIPLDSIKVDIKLGSAKGQITIEAEASTRAATGVEMEAMTAVAVAALTIYDMCKGIDRTIEIGNVRLIAKSGGRSGDWRRPKGARAGRSARPTGRPVRRA